MRKLLFIAALLFAFPCHAQTWNGAKVNTVNGAKIDRWNGMSLGGGSSCSGTFGYTENGTSFDGPGTGGMALQAVTTTCAATSGTWYWRSDYINTTGREYQPVIYKADGTLLWAGTQTAYIEGSANPHWVSEAFSVAAMPAGTYYVGAITEIDTSKIFRTADAGNSYKIKTGFTIGSPSASIVIGGFTSVSNYHMSAYIIF